MKLTAQEISEIEDILSGIHLTKEAELMKQFISHGCISTYDHVMSVVRLSFYFNRHFHLRASEAELVRGAFLHDFYLYDWHKNGCPGKLHGFYHPKAALRNAAQRYRLTKRERNIIASHMWPLTLFTFPKYKEAVIVCVADKICSAYETVARRTG